MTRSTHRPRSSFRLGAWTCSKSLLTPSSVTLCPSWRNISMHVGAPLLSTHTFLPSSALNKLKPAHSHPLSLPFAQALKPHSSCKLPGFAHQDISHPAGTLKLPHTRRNAKFRVVSRVTPRSLRPTPKRELSEPNERTANASIMTSNTLWARSLSRSLRRSVWVMRSKRRDLERRWSRR